MTPIPVPFVDAVLLTIIVIAVIVLSAGLVTIRRRLTALDLAIANLDRDNERVRFALEGSSLVIWEWDIAGGSIWLNANWKELLGARPRETRAPIAELAALVHPEDLERLRQVSISSLKGQVEQADAEFRVRGIDETWRWVRSRGMVTARGAQGRALRASGTIADITSRKLSEKWLAESEARFRALTGLSADLYWEQDRQFHLVSWSAPAWTLGGDSMLPRPALDAPELTEADWAQHRDVLEQRQPFRDLEIHQTGPDGRESWLSVGAVPIVDERGEFRGYRGLARIITDRKLAEQRLRQSELQRRQLVEFMPAAILFVNHERRVVVHNKAYAALLGLRDDAIEGRPVRDVLGEERYLTLEPHLLRALQGEPGHFESRRPGPDHRIVDLDVLLWPLRGAEDQVEGVIILGIDVTRLKEADRMKDHFVSVVSHELRTPLTAMRGSLGLLAGGVAGDLPQEAKSLVDIALNNSDRLWRLVNDLLDIEKVSSGHVEFRHGVIDWHALLLESVEASRGLMQRYDVSFELADFEGLRVVGDTDRLSQVLSNLILNAAKFSPAGSVVTVGAQRGAGGTVRTSVRDHGPGIPQDFRERIFQPFSQASTGDSRTTGGTGLGLAISREIVTRLGGKIGFEDAPGGGTIFWFDLPEAQVAE